MLCVILAALALVAAFKMYRSNKGEITTVAKLLQVLQHVDGESVQQLLAIAENCKWLDRWTRLSKSVDMTDAEIRHDVLLLRAAAMEARKSALEAAGHLATEQAKEVAVGYVTAATVSYQKVRETASALMCNVDPLRVQALEECL
jgi:hypothetical protein